MFKARKFNQRLQYASKQRGLVVTSGQDPHDGIHRHVVEFLELEPADVPSPDQFSLKKLVDDGVKLQHVDCMLLGASGSAVAHADELVNNLENPVNNENK